MCKARKLESEKIQVHQSFCKTSFQIFIDSRGQYHIQETHFPGVVIILEEQPLHCLQEKQVSPSMTLLDYRAVQTTSKLFRSLARLTSLSNFHLRFHCYQ